MEGNEERRVDVDVRALRARSAKTALYVASKSFANNKKCIRSDDLSMSCFR